ncbi:MAG: GntR family transcriptional regulator [Chloroflexi bacterium]|nr:GntR family transcriptional regulator [Chloroflexota bacterium]MBI3168378.1 GntR family transcriptional regulator [Chloroflexota bacterium]
MNSDTHRQLRNVVADKMRAAILDGHYKPGEWLRQERLAQELGVSQMPVREALNELVNEGLIEHVPYRGARVIKFSIEDITDLYEHRAFLEGRAAYFSAQVITERELNNLKKIQAGMEENDAPEAVLKYRELNRSFHKTIFTISKHEYLIRTLNQMWAAFPTMLIANFAATALHPLPERDSTDREEHQAIVTALEAHNPAQAEQAMRDHILATKRQLVSFLKATP